MLSTRDTLNRMAANLSELMGVRDRVTEPAHLSPMPRAKDVGRRPDASFAKVATDRVIPDPTQPRDLFSDESLDRLAHSIREKGQLSPIRVRWSEEHDRWIIIAGERRWQATKRAGLPTIDCYCHEGELSHSEVLEQQLIEKLLREDLQPIEEAKAFGRLMNMNGWNAKQLATELHVAPAKVSRSLALLKLPDDVRAQVTSGQLSSRAAYELSRITDNAACRKLAAQAVARKWTHDQTAKAVRTRRGKRRRRPGQFKLTFATDSGWKIVASHTGNTTYHDLKAAIAEVMDEIDARIAGNVGLY